MQERPRRALAALLAASVLGSCTGSIDYNAGPPHVLPAEPPRTGGSGGSAASSAGAGAVEAPGEQPASGGTSAVEEVPPPPPVCDAPTQVLMASCGNGSCHSNAGTTIGDFAADPERIYDFVDKLSVRNADCGSIIDSRDYSQSFLLLKVLGDFPIPKCGEIMPPGSFQITEEQIDCLANWLQQFQK